MKDYALELASKREGYNAKLNTIREYLQAYILRILHTDSLFKNSAFLGGTALRFLYNLPRFSEDLDFSLLKADSSSFLDSINKLKGELTLAGYDVSIKYSEENTVKYALIKFEELMHDLGLSPHKDQLLSIKIDIDTNPPLGAGFKPQIINKYFPLSFMFYDLSSLLAGKIHAVLCRNYTKGRDYFDLCWYLSRWKDCVPNIEFLVNALKQTDYQGQLPDNDNWRQILYKAVEDVDWKLIYKDVENFLENEIDNIVFTKENILKLIKMDKSFS